MGSDRKTPVDPVRAPRPRQQTERGLPAPPGQGNRRPPIPREDPEASYRRPSPPPVEEPPTSAELGAKVVELGEAREALEDASAVVQALRDELRAIKAETAARRQPEPRVESVPPNGDRELGRAIRVLLGRIAGVAISSLLGAGAAGVYAYQRTEPVAAVEVRTELQESARAKQREREIELYRWARELTASTECARDRADQAFRWFMPEPDQNQRKPGPWLGFRQVCPPLPKPPSEAE